MSNEQQRQPQRQLSAVNAHAEDPVTSSNEKLKVALSVLKRERYIQDKELQVCVQLLEEAFEKNNDTLRSLESTLLTRLPMNVQRRLNENGEIQWNAKTVLLVLLCGERVHVRVAYFIGGSLARIIVYVVVNVILITLIGAGLMAAIPREWFLLFLTVEGILALITIVTVVDYELAKLVAVNDEKFIVNLTLVLLFGWSVGVLLDWNYRAIGLIVFVFIQTLVLYLVDAMNFHIRKTTAIPMGLSYVLYFVFYLVIFNLGWIPGTEGAEMKTLFTFNAFERSIPYTAYNGLNTALVALLGLGLNELKIRYLYRKTAQLRTLCIPLVGVDEFSYIDYSYLDKFIG